MPPKKERPCHKRQEDILEKGGLDMKYDQRLILILVCLILLASFFASCSPGQSNSGVAQIDEQQKSESATGSATRSDTSSDIAWASAPATSVPSDNPETSVPAATPVPTSTPKLTDEEIATLFTACLRDHGFNVDDPELNADGTVNLQGLRQGLFQDPNFQKNGQKALEDCVPLLQGATFAQPPSAEDQIEFQDRLLKFTQCLRDEGLDVPDPDFSTGTRAAMGAIFQGINRQSNKVQEAILACREGIFTGERPGG
jgi:hypothetical protein